jgi:hypothetical protein
MKPAPKDTIEIYPPEEFFDKAYKGLSILRNCHQTAGGTSMLSSYGRDRISLNLRGSRERVSSTLRHGSKIYTLLMAWRAKASGHEVTLNPDRKVPRL